MVFGLSSLERIRKSAATKYVVYFTILTYAANHAKVIMGKQDAPVVVIDNPAQHAQVFNQDVWSPNALAQFHKGSKQINMGVNKNFKFSFPARFTYARDFKNTKFNSESQTRKQIRDELWKEFRIVKDSIMFDLKKVLGSEGIDVEKLNQKQLEDILQELLNLQHEELNQIPAIIQGFINGYTCWLGGYDRNVPLSEIRTDMFKKVFQEELQRAFKKFFGIDFDMNKYGNVIARGKGPNMGVTNADKELNKFILTKLRSYIASSNELYTKVKDMGLIDVLRATQVTEDNIDDINKIVDLLEFSKDREHQKLYARILTGLDDLRRVDVELNMIFNFHLNIIANKSIPTDERTGQPGFILPAPAERERRPEDDEEDTEPEEPEEEITDTTNIPPEGLRIPKDAKFKKYSDSTGREQSHKNYKNINLPRGESRTKSNVQRMNGHSKKSSGKVTRQGR